MSKTIAFLYDLTSPNAYLAHRVLPDIAARHGAGIVMKPVLLGGIFNATNNQSPVFKFADVPAKLSYLRLEIARFAEHHAVEFTMNSQFPVHPVAQMRAATFAQGKPWEAAFIDAMFNATWVQDQNTSDPAVMEQVLETAQLPARDIMNAILLPDIKEALKTATAEAVERGAFGAPTFFIDKAMFFGKDSLGSIDDYLAGRISQ